MLQRWAYVVIAREDRQHNGDKGGYTLATRKSFSTKTEAEDYAQSISESREPIIVFGRWHEIA